jgi:hypothetical protein
MHLKALMDTYYELEPGASSAKYKIAQEICQQLEIARSDWDHQGPHRDWGKRDSLQEKKQIFPADPCIVYEFDLRDCFCVSIIIPLKSVLAENIEFAKQVWAFAAVSIPPKILNISSFFYPSRWGRYPIFIMLQSFGEIRSTRCNERQYIWPDFISCMILSENLE